MIKNQNLSYCFGFLLSEVEVFYANRFKSFSNQTYHLMGGGKFIKGAKIDSRDINIRLRPI